MAFSASYETFYYVSLCLKKYEFANLEVKQAQFQASLQGVLIVLALLSEPYVFYSPEAKLSHVVPYLIHVI